MYTIMYIYTFVNEYIFFFRIKKEHINGYALFNFIYYLYNPNTNTLSIMKRKIYIRSGASNPNKSIHVVKIPLTNAIKEIQDALRSSSSHTRILFS